MDAIEALNLPESRWVDVNGPVHYCEWPGPGGADELTMVCVHGLGGSLLNWAPVAPGLAKRSRVLALDLAGFGLTPPEGRSTHVGANWRLLDGFLKALDLPPVVLVGNSMGGMISLIECAHNPQAVAGMILVDAAFPRTRTAAGQFNPRVAAVFGLYSNRLVGERFAANRARRLGPERLVAETLRVSAADPSTLDPILVEAMVESVRRRQGMDYATRAFLDAARSIFRAQVAPGRYRELVRRAHGPALVIHGRRDQLVPLAAARQAVSGHDDWELAVLDDVGHIPQMEAPALWLSTVEDWLDRTSVLLKEPVQA